MQRGKGKPFRSRLSVKQYIKKGCGLHYDGAPYPDANPLLAMNRRKSSFAKNRNGRIGNFKL